MILRMILRLDPRPPLVWRTPTSLQIGVDPVRAVLPRVDDADVSMIGALGTGVTRSGLDLVAQRAGAAPARVDELLAQLTPVLEGGRAERSTARALIVIGEGRGARRVADVLAEAGHAVRLSAAGMASEDAALRLGTDDVGVLVDRHVVDPREHLAWLRRDAAHLPVVFGEHGVVVGPLVVPGVTACLGCVSLHRTDADAAWPAIATQVQGTAAAAESPLLATRAALEVLAVLEVARDDGVSIRLDALTAERTITPIAPHPRCGCLTIA